MLGWLPRGWVVARKTWMILVKKPFQAIHKHILARKPHNCLLEIQDVPQSRNGSMGSMICSPLFSLSFSGLLWSSLGLAGPLWPHPASSWPIWAALGRYGPLWASMCLSGHTCASLGLSSWAYLCIHGPLLGFSGPLLASLAFSGQSPKQPTHTHNKHTETFHKLPTTRLHPEKGTIKKQTQTL